MTGCGSISPRRPTWPRPKRILQARLDGGHALNLFTIPPGVPFLDALAAEWLDARGGDPLAVARGLILLPTRRAARALAEAFLRASGGRPLLLPRITALGALDEAPLTLAGALDLPPAVEPAQRLAALTPADPGDEGRERRAAHRRPRLAAGRRTRRADGRGGAGGDRSGRAGCPRPPIPAYAAHWAQTLEFLHIVTRSWPDWLAEQGLMNPAARQVALLDAQAAAWDAAPPVGAGAGRRHHGRHSRGGAAAARGRAAAERRGGAAGPGHRDVRARLGRRWMTRIRRPACARLLHGLGATRGDVRAWPAAAPTRRSPARGATLSPRAAAGRRRLAEWRNAAPGGDRRPDAAVARRPAGGSRRHRHGAARGARNAGGHRGAGDAGSRPGRPGGDRAAALRRGGRRQRRRGAGRIAAGRVPAPAGPRRGGGTGAGARCWRC